VADLGPVLCGRHRQDLDAALHQAGGRLDEHVEQVGAVQDQGGAEAADHLVGVHAHHEPTVPGPDAAVHLGRGERPDPVADADVVEGA